MRDPRRREGMANTSSASSAPAAAPFSDQVLLPREGIRFEAEEARLRFLPVCFYTLVPNQRGKEKAGSMKLHLAFSVMEKCRLQRRIQATPHDPSLPSLRLGCVSIDFHAISFAVAIMVGFMLKRRLSQWAVRMLKRFKDDN